MENIYETKTINPCQKQKAGFIVGCVFSAIALLINIFFIAVSIDAIFSSYQLTTLGHALTVLSTYLMFIIWTVSALPSCIIAVLLLGLKSPINKKVSITLIIVTSFTTILCGILIYFLPQLISV